MITTELQNKASALIADGKIRDCFDLFETEIKKVPTTPYYMIVGRNLLHLTESFSLYISKLYNFSAHKIAPKTIYLELNGFSIDPDLWFIDAFGYKNFFGLDDFDWL